MTIGASSPRGLLVEWIELRSRVEAARAKAIITAVEADLLLKFSEDQPRDESGRWTSSGGGGSDGVEERRAGGKRAGAGARARKEKAPTVNIKGVHKDVVAGLTGPVMATWGELGGPKGEPPGRVWKIGDGPEIKSEDIIKLEDVIRSKDSEALLLVGADGRAVLALTGTKDSVPIPSALRGTDKFLGATLTHNHPNSASFSEGDVGTMLMYGIKEMHAVSEMGGKKIDHVLIDEDPHMPRGWHTRGDGLGNAPENPEDDLETFRGSIHRCFADNFEKVVTPQRTKEVLIEAKFDPDSARGKKIMREAYYIDSHKIVTGFVEQLNRELGRKLKYKRVVS